MFADDIDGNVAKFLLAYFWVDVKASQLLNHNVQIWVCASAEQLLSAAIRIGGDGAIQSGLAGGIEKHRGERDGSSEFSYTFRAVKDPGVMHAFRSHGIAQKADRPLLPDDGIKRDRNRCSDWRGAFVLCAIDDARGSGLCRG